MNLLFECFDSIPNRLVLASMTRAIQSHIAAENILSFHKSAYKITYSILKELYCFSAITMSAYCFCANFFKFVT